jgi:hypothetical protein
VSLAGNLDAPENWYGGFYELAICLEVVLGVVDFEVAVPRLIPALR